MVNNFQPPVPVLFLKHFYTSWVAHFHQILIGYHLGIVLVSMVTKKDQYSIGQVYRNINGALNSP